MTRRPAREIRLTRQVRIDRRGAEALKIALRRAARELGLSVAALQVRRLEEPAAPAPPAAAARKAPSKPASKRRAARPR